jgi:hypothetical protein
MGNSRPLGEENEDGEVNYSLSGIDLRDVIEEGSQASLKGGMDHICPPLGLGEWNKVDFLTFF